MCDRKYSILGTGALGGFYGARLQKAGLDTHFLLNSDYQHVSQYGLFIESKSVEAIFGNSLRKAQAAGVDLPHISCLYHQLKFLDAQNKLK